MTNDPRGTSREAEAKAALERVKRDSETVLGSSMNRAAQHFSGADAPDGDRIELWGRRIGRTLSLLGVVVLAWWLGHQLKVW